MGRRGGAVHQWQDIGAERRGVARAGQWSGTATRDDVAGRRHNGAVRAARCTSATRQRDGLVRRSGATRRYDEGVARRRGRDGAGGGEKGKRIDDDLGGGVGGRGRRSRRPPHSQPAS